MHYCPYCGTAVREDEYYCVQCGKKLPSDIDARFKKKKQINKYWLLPLAATVIIIALIGLSQLILQNKTAQAKELYTEGEQELLDGNYDQAIQSLEKALEHKKGFKQASITLDYIYQAMDTEKTVQHAEELAGNKQFQDALSLLNQVENELNHYNGQAVNQLIDDIKSKHDSIKIEQLYDELDQEPNIDELKILLWDAESIGKDAEEITDTIRNEIIDYSFSKASELISEKQFTEAYLFVEDALKYAPDSEKLNSLKTTIDKERTTFETAQQQRIEQAMNIAQADQELNETNAIELTSSGIEIDNNGNLVVKGEVESVATIPIHSILVEYSLLGDNEKEILSNEVFVYPDTLYPDESGKFEFTHYDLNVKKEQMKLKVDKITWYTD
ncbi:zinc-ribbon domain-containing protein [Oceanobacillus salinisoli]|uniref:zinc-ribbon domain-containing protein n=1 Tax=Oceanobacillus salinisoli TaxID=2678611 RepID=UPI0012E26F49|nr:zinc-ribbon domain-containing protein [Oceanobacillus salinisoli]